MWVSMIVRFLKILMTFLLALLFFISFIPLIIVDIIRYIIWDISEEEWSWTFFVRLISKMYEN